MGKWCNKHLEMVLKLLRESFPQAMNDLPKSYNESKKLMKDMVLGYEKIDACRNDCTLYWGVNEEEKLCATCNGLRW